MRTIIRRGCVALLGSSALYLVVLAYPQPLFAYEMRHAGIVLHSTQPVPAAMAATLERVRARLDRSPLSAAAGDAHVFICHSRSLFALFARQNYRVGGIADWLVGQHVFLRESDMTADRLIGPSGHPVAADRPLSYFIAHELMHIATARSVGRHQYARLPQWVDDGYADYVARDIDYAAALHAFKGDARELDPARSGLYLRYHLMVAYLLERQGMTVSTLMTDPPPRERVEEALRNLARW